MAAIVLCYPTVVIRDVHLHHIIQTYLPWFVIRHGSTGHTPSPYFIRGGGIIQGTWDHFGLIFHREQSVSGAETNLPNNLYAAKCEPNWSNMGGGLKGQGGAAGRVERGTPEWH